VDWILLVFCGTIGDFMEKLTDVERCLLIEGDPDSSGQRSSLLLLRFVVLGFCNNGCGALWLS
jgi:hypothetical protein